MRILALEASGTRVGLAAVEADELQPGAPVAVNELADTRQLSQHLINGFAATLAQAGWSMDSVDGIGVGIGPGSWTSLRVALSTVKTLAQVRGWKLVGIPTFDAIAGAIWSSPYGSEENESPLQEPFLLAVVGRCRPGQVYAKIFECSPEYLVVVQPEWVSAPEGVADTLGVEALVRGGDTPLVIAGDAAEDVSAVLKEQDDRHVVADVPIEALAIEIGRSAAAAIESGEESSPLELQPLYIALSAAERNLQK